MQDHSMQPSETVSGVSRRKFLATVAGTSCAALLNGCKSAVIPEVKRPNILFAFADDQSWPHASAYGSKFVNTPAFDRVAREGALFNNSFSVCPSCTPSRSSVLTGRQIWQIEQGGILYGTLPAEYPLFTHLLEDAGYHVGYTGKGWVPGNWQAGGLTRYPIGKEYNSLMMSKPIADGIETWDYSANFEAFLEKRRTDSPFFFWYGCKEPHRVYEDGIGLKSGKQLEDVEVPAFLPDTDLVRSDLLDYAYEIEWFDSHLSRMLAKLEQIGELDNTLIVVTSDNGMPFPRAKVNLYELGVHMPLAIRWPGKIQPGRVVDDFTSHIDFAATFLEAAGLAVPAGIEGRSLIPILTSSASGLIDATRDRVYTALERHTWCRPDGATYPIRGIRTKEYLYLRNFEPDRWPTGGPTFVSSNKTFHGDVDACPTKTFMLKEENMDRFSKEYDLSFGKRPLEELYDIQKDPDQINNLASDPEFQDVKQQLWSELSRYLQKTGDPRIEGLDPWQGYIYHQTIGFGATFNQSITVEEREKAAGRGSHKPE